MKSSISCSFGEIVDKVTILCIKQTKLKDNTTLTNISLELETIRKENPLVNNTDILFDELYKINKKLWILEDIIRDKSSKKSFDKQYIDCAESIHTTNDERYQIKRKINIKYGSELIEEKGYAQSHTKSDLDQLERGKQCYTEGKYTESYEIISKIMQQHAMSNKVDSFMIDLLFSYQNIVNMFHMENPHYGKIQSIMSNIENIDVPNEQNEFMKTNYASYCLQNNDYTNASPYLNQLNSVSGPNVNKKNMSFFSETDSNKTLLVYDGGGIGDKIMLARFIPILCKLYCKNHIIFVTDENIVYLFKACFEIPNLHITTFANVGRFDYHCSLLSLIQYLHIEYSDITFQPLFTCIPTVDALDIKCENKRQYILNWKGNPKNAHELHNRRMDLNCAVPLFKIPDVEWTVITQNITTDERDLLQKHNVKFYGNFLDTGVKCFEDSISIIKQVDGVVSTDTSLVHLSANLGVKTYVLLTLGCEWRWSPNDETTRWYPDAVLLKQTKMGDWTDVITNLEQILREPRFP